MAKKSKAVMQPVTVNPEKIVRGLTTVFQGFSVMFEGMAEQMQLIQDMTEQLGFFGVASQEDTPKAEEVAENVITEDKACAPADVAADEADHDTDETVHESKESDSDPDEADTPPWEETKKQNPVQKSVSGPSEQTDSPVSNLTQSDLTKVIVSKIKLKRENNAKIGKLLRTYGVSLLSDLPAEKYEAFLNDLSQI